jgi:SOS-response transcriptional repressor LexA
MSELRPAARRTIPIAPALEGDLGACSGAEPFALMVLGDSMAPEFVEGDVIVIEPEGLATDGAFVLAFVRDEWIFRQLAARGGAWSLRALDARYATIDIPDLSAVRGVVIQKSRPGKRRALKRYGPP